LERGALVRLERGALVRLLAAECERLGEALGVELV
jgi:hypothetical protein